jgi:hypothetical protein
MSAGLLACVALGFAGAQPEGDAAPPALPAWVAPRLTALAPDRPDEYFRLAEEIADIADEAHEEAAARTLYALGYELARARPATAPLAASCCLGLAQLERLDQDRRWLLAVAAAVDPRYSRPDWAVPASASASEETAFKAASALGLARSGEGPQSRKMLDEPGVKSLLREYERAIGDTGTTGALFRLERHIAEWPCPQCSNTRVIARPAQPAPDIRLCPTCRGDPGPRLSPQEFLAQLRFEAILLRGVQRSWAAQVAVDMGAPLRDPDPDQLAEVYGVDPARAYWREGNWVTAAEAGG